MKKRAFTMLEMIVVVVIIMTITAASLPSFLKFANTSRLRAAARDITTALRTTRRYAITQRQTYATAIYVNDNVNIQNAVSVYETVDTVEVHRLPKTIRVQDDDGDEDVWLVFAFSPRGNRGSAPPRWGGGTWDTIRVVDADNRYIDIIVNTLTGRVSVGEIRTDW